MCVTTYLLHNHHSCNKIPTIGLKSAPFLYTCNGILPSFGNTNIKQIAIDFQLRLPFPSDNDNNYNY